MKVGKVCMLLVMFASTIHDYHLFKYFILRDFNLLGGIILGNNQQGRSGGVGGVCAKSASPIDQGKRG